MVEKKLVFLIIHYVLVLTAAVMFRKLKLFVFLLTRNQVRITPEATMVNLTVQKEMTHPA